MKFFTEGFMETFVEASTTSPISIEASTTSMEASTTSKNPKMEEVEASITSMKVWKLKCGNFHESFHQLPRKMQIMYEIALVVT